MSQILRVTGSQEQMFASADFWGAADGDWVRLQPWAFCPLHTEIYLLKCEIPVWCHSARAKSVQAFNSRRDFCEMLWCSGGYGGHYHKSNPNALPFPCSWSLPALSVSKSNAFIIINSDALLKFHFHFCLFVTLSFFLLYLSCCSIHSIKSWSARNTKALKENCL